MAASNMELFDEYFKRADLDRDGRISGAEAVAFFQGANLPKQVLAQIWMHADQNRTGFLGRPEFYNALKLVTVAQSGRELTPDIIKAALFGSAAAKIPPPKINPMPVPAAQTGSMVTPRPQIGSAAPPSTQTGIVPPKSQNFGFRGPQAHQNFGVNQQVPSSFNNSYMRPPIATAAGLLPVQGVSQGLPTGGTGPRFPGMNTPNLSTDWLGSRTNGPSVGDASVSGSTPGLAPKTPASAVLPTSVSSRRHSDPVLSSLQSTTDSKALVLSGNGFPSDSVFGEDTFSATQARPSALTSSFSASGLPNAASGAPMPAGSQNSVKSDQPDPFKNIVTLPRGGNQLQQYPSVVKQNQPESTPSTSTSNASNISSGAVGSGAAQAQLQWPKITQADIRKYTKVFVEVDKDRDGKITGQEARNLFLSWRLPREVLKQVWDLSDEDNDSMLSLREFCIALYLMERYREGGPLPPVFPDKLKFDETLLQATGRPPTAYGGPSLHASPGFSQQGNPASSPVMAAYGPRPSMYNSVGSLPDGFQPLQNMPGVRTSERNLQNQQRKDELGIQVGTNEDEVQEKERILDSREKIEFYRTKMQELVLYKSRCDNRLNEISERASADKREVELLAKKYEEKYKQVADIASKLTVEEATFHHIQERKVELQNAIVKMEHGGSVDGLLQVRADRIQNDLEEIAKSLSERCKQHGIDVKTTASVQLPFGWQPGIQEGVVDWDEEWDKFEDEGFTTVKELSSGPEGIAAPEKSSPSLEGDEVFADDLSTSEPSSDIFRNASEHMTDNGGADSQSEDGSARNPHGSPGRATFDSPRGFQSPLHDASPHAKDNYSDHGGGESTFSDDKFGAESMFSGDKFGDESSWGGNFDTNDDVDSVWGFNTKDTFGSGDFGLNPVKIYSPGSSTEFGKDKSLFLADSVPTSPLFNSTSLSSFNDRLDNHSFDASSRFDSFSMRDGGLFQQRESLSRFDSIRSTTADLDHNRDYSFDVEDPFGSTGPFKSTGTTNSPRKGSDKWNGF